MCRSLEDHSTANVLVGEIDLSVGIKKNTKKILKHKIDFQKRVFFAIAIFFFLLLHSKSFFFKTCNFVAKWSKQMKRILPNEKKKKTENIFYLLYQSVWPIVKGGQKTHYHLTSSNFLLEWVYKLICFRVWTQTAEKFCVPNFVSVARPKLEE